MITLTSSFSLSVGVEVACDVFYGISDSSESLEIFVSDFNVEFVFCFEHDFDVGERADADILPSGVELDRAWVLHCVV